MPARFVRAGMPRAEQRHRSVRPRQQAVLLRHHALLHDTGHQWLSAFGAENCTIWNVVPGVPRTKIPQSLQFFGTVHSALSDMGDTTCLSRQLMVSRSSFPFIFVN